MNILICASEYYPYGSGIANVAYNVVEHLKKMGIECKVCSPNGPDITLGSFKLIKKCGIIGLIYYWYQVSVFFKNHNSDFDVAWCHNPFFFKNNPFNRCLITMNSTYYGEATEGAYPLHLKIYKKIVSKLEKYSLNNLDSGVRFTGVGNNVCKELEKIGIQKERINYIQNGVCTEKFKPSCNKNDLRTKFGLPEDEVLILSIGRLSKIKQTLKLVEVFSLIEKLTTGINLIIAGNGELFDETKRFIERNKLKRVFLLGHVGHQRDAPDLYACSDYFIISSKYEGGEPPLTLSEAMSSGLPCIVSDIPNFRIVENANCGIVVDFNNVELAAERIIGYIKRDNSQHSINARTYATKYLGWEKIAENYLKEFHKLEHFRG